MVADDIAVRALTSLPDGIDELLRASVDEGHNLVRRLVEDWLDGSNQFDAPGEIFVEARVGARLAGLGGLNQDPYLDDPSVARLRHLYVLPELRRRGVGRAVVGVLVDQARTSFSRMRLRTTREEAARFYSTLGFQQVAQEPDATHVIWF